MYFEGVIIGLASFLIIGVFHPAIIRGEYHFGTKIWPLFMIAGIAFCCLSLFAGKVIVSAIFGVIGFCCFWSIHELFEQKKRVERGWFPKKPQ
jgi:uncharacterized membrane protein YuzA (DUF378 family)